MKQRKSRSARIPEGHPVPALGCRFILALGHRKQYTSSIMRRLGTKLAAVALFLAVCLAQTALTNDDILKMAKAGLSEEVLLSAIKAQPGRYATTPDDLIALKGAGVSDKVIAAMMEQAASGGNPSTTRRIGEESKDRTPAVLICGTGSSPYYENIVDQLLDSLIGRKVTVKSVESHAFARGTCLQKTNEANAGSLLYVVTNISERNSKESFVSIQCFSADGKQLWEEDQRGPILTASVTSTVKGITEKMKKKLQAHVGELGLPMSK